jgi:hypothetical protein
MRGPPALPCLSDGSAFGGGGPGGAIGGGELERSPGDDCDRVP